MKIFTKKNMFFAVILAVFVLFATEAQENESEEMPQWDIATLDSARDVEYLSPIEKDVVLEMNMARTNPALYAELYIEPRLKDFNGKRYKLLFITVEGKKAVEECVSVMKKTKPLGVLYAQKGLSLAAQQHAKTQGETKQVGHIGVDGSKFSDRIKKYGGSYTKRIGENISYGKITGREIVIQLLIDDGVANRGHRKNILNGEFDSTGVGFSEKHRAYGSLCVITYAGGYSEK